MSKYFTIKICFALLVLLVLSKQSYPQKITLEQSIEEALKHNPELLKQGKKVKAAKAGIWEAVSLDDPHVFMELEEIPENSNSFDDYGEKKIGIQQEIEFPLNYYFKAKWQNLEKARAYNDYLLTKNDLIGKVKTKFNYVLLLKDQNLLFDEILHVSNQLFQKARVRVLAGESTSYDTLKVKVDLAEVENKKFLIEKKYKLALSELAMILGRENSNNLEIEGELSYKPTSLSVDTLQNLALANHPVLKQTQAFVNQKKTERNLTWTGLLPNFELKYFQQEFQGISTEKAWGGEIGLSVPLFFFLKGQGKIRAASYNVDGAKWEQVSVERKVCFKVKEAFSKLQVAEKHFLNYKNNLSLVEELVRIATRSYEEGEMGYLEVAEALRSLNRTKAGLSEALFSYLKARADLEQAVGVSLFESK
jgi:outer membrane protein, heavy metal efflux system